MANQHTTPPLDSAWSSDHNVRKRVGKACDRCRLKKSKCDGSSPCSRCKADNAICIFGERKKSHDKVYPKGYVEMLENQQSQLVVGLQELYKRVQTGQGWAGHPLVETSNGMPLTHDILERLGALKQDGHSTGELFEEDPLAMQHRLIQNGAGMMQRELSSDSESDVAHSPIFDQPPPKSISFSDPFALKGFPPTPPPSTSPYPRMRQGAPSKLPSFALSAIDPTGMNAALLERNTWGSITGGFNDPMDFMTDFDSPMNMDAMSSMFASNAASNGVLNLSQSMGFLDDDFINPQLL